MKQNQGLSFFQNFNLKMSPYSNHQHKSLPQHEKEEENGSVYENHCPFAPYEVPCSSAATPSNDNIIYADTVVSAAVSERGALIAEKYHTTEDVLGRLGLYKFAYFLSR